MKIQVTKEHIKKGERENENYCPIALAILDQIEGASCVEVYAHEIEFFLGDKLFKRFPTAAMVDFIESFDAGEKVEPFEFSLTAINQ